MGKRPNRETIIEPLTPRNSTVPTAGAGRNRPRPEPGPMEPQPQARPFHIGTEPDRMTALK